MKIAIMAGGTGGHIFPGLAVADELLAMGHQVIWLGAKGGMEEGIVTDKQLPLELLEIKGIRGKGLMGLIKLPFRLFSTTLKAMKIFKNEKVNAVLSMGGYVAGPGGLAAKIKGIPLIVHEQNSKFGMTNKYLSKWAAKILTGFDLRGMYNSQAVGNPVRAEIESVQRSNSNEITRILVVGGSLGAQSMNTKLPAVFKNLSQKHDFQVIHQCGRNKLSDTERNYQGFKNVQVKEFITDMSAAYSQADFIIARAGALTIAEINAVGIPAIFIPYPYAVDDHQTSNAEKVVENKAAMIWQESDTTESLTEKIEQLLSDKEALIRMSLNSKELHIPHAAKTVANACLEVAK